MAVLTPLPVQAMPRLQDMLLENPVTPTGKGYNLEWFFSPVESKLQPSCVPTNTQGKGQGTSSTLGQRIQQEEEIPRASNGNS